MTFGAQKEKAKNIWAQNIMVIALSEHLNSCRRGGKHMIFQKGVSKRECRCEIWKQENGSNIQYIQYVLYIIQ